MQQRNPYEPTQASLGSASSPAPETYPPGILQYAGFWRRFGAFWIDALILLPLSGVAYFFGEMTRMFYVYWLVPGLLIGLWFHVHLVARYGGTPGKLLLKTRIAMVDGAPVTVKAAVLRYAVLFVLSVFSSVALTMSSLAMTDAQYFSLGYFARSQRLVETAPSWYVGVNVLLQVWIWGEFVTMLFNKKRRAVHDFIAGTVVVRSRP
jgi:uncharacterized RDD family membrane protein YckC